MKLSEPVTAAHLINAAKLGNSKADAVLNKGQRTKQAHIHMILIKFKQQMGYLVNNSGCKQTFQLCRTIAMTVSHYM